jgi:hypothetical protein
MSGQAMDPCGLFTPSVITLAMRCAHMQASAGLKKPDVRIFNCPYCNAPGFNTGWGYSAFDCGAEILSDSEVSTECPSQKAEAA